MSDWLDKLDSESSDIDSYDSAFYTWGDAADDAGVSTAAGWVGDHALNWGVIGMGVVLIVAGIAAVIYTGQKITLHPQPKIAA